jgi:hypothetical protein
MNQHPLLPLLQVQAPQTGTPKRETETEIFERLAANMRDDRRRARRAHRLNRARRLIGVAPDRTRKAA